MKIFFVILLCFVQFAALATESNPCSLSSVRKLTVPVYPDRDQSKSFKYSFQYYPPKDPSSITVIVVPGGPGIGLIEDWDSSQMAQDWHDMGLPEKAGILFTEPRTVGCNAGDEKIFPDDALRTNYLASDILASIRSLKLKKYIIYGHSYGTVLSTTLAHMAEKDLGPGPMAVVLTGVIGKALRGGEGSVFEGLVDEWKKLFDFASENVKGRLRAKLPPLGLSEENWSTVIEDGLYLGRTYSEGEFYQPLKNALELMSHWNSPSDKKALEILRELSNLKKIEKNTEDDKWSQRLFEIIDCAELTDSEPFQSFSRGELIIIGDDCTHRPKLTRPFDSAEQLIRAPIYYFQGTSDPATPERYARYHFENQIKSERMFIQIPGGGHNRIGAYFDDCKEEIWKAISSKQDSFISILNKCGFFKEICSDAPRCSSADFVSRLRPE